MSSKKKKILVLGSGNFGTCLAQHLALNGCDVCVWSHHSDVVDSINKHHRNPRYLSSAQLAKNMTATSDLSEETVAMSGVILLAIPTQALRSVLSKVKNLITESHLLICAAKGIEIESLEFPGGIIESVLGPGVAKSAVFLSGPSFASEVVQRLPTAVSLASENPERCFESQKLFHADVFRAYSSDDPTGLEVAGALKNVIAIASGAVTGLGFESNSRAALVTRGLAEITKVGVALGAKPLTFTGLGGVGDLFLTCSSEKSRNFSLGYQLAKGKQAKDILSSMGSVAEGYYTAKAVHDLGRKLKVQIPICDQVYKVLYENKPIEDAVRDLLTREAKPELDGIQSPPL